MALVEIAGVTYVTREVYMAQDFERYRRVVGELKAFVDLEHLAEEGKPEAYLSEYYRLDGRSQRQADTNISLAKHLGTFDADVDKVRRETRRAFERPRGPLADQTLEYRRHRLVRGVILIVLALATHGLYG
jgi:hypothetical protein